MCECTKPQSRQSTKNCIALGPKTQANFTIPTHGKLPALTWMPDARARSSKRWYYLQTSCKHPGVCARFNGVSNCVVRNTWMGSVRTSRKVCVCGDKRNIKHCSKIQAFPVICKTLPITGTENQFKTNLKLPQRNKKYPTTYLTNSKEHLKCFPYRWL